MLARENDRSLGVRGGLKSFDAAFVNLLGFFDRFELVLEAHADGTDVSLDPDERWSIAGVTEDFDEFFAVFLGIIAAFDDERGAGFGDFGNK